MGTISDDIRVSTAARMRKYLFPLSPRTIQLMCVQGCFRTAHKKGMGKNSPWFISGAEIIQWKINRHAIVQDN
jgi:hypothetical protein